MCGRPDRAVSPRGSRENKHGATPTTETSTWSSFSPALSPLPPLPSTSPIPSTWAMSEALPTSEVCTCYSLCLEYSSPGLPEMGPVTISTYRWGNRHTERLNSFDVSAGNLLSSSGYAVPASVSKHNSVSNLPHSWHSNWFTSESTASLSQLHKDVGT